MTGKTAGLWYGVLIDTTTRSTSVSEAMCVVSPWYAFTVCPSSSECFFADAVDDASEVVDTATILYLFWRDGWRSEGASRVEAQPVAESPTKPTRMGEDIVSGWILSTFVSKFKQCLYQNRRGAIN